MLVHINSCLIEKLSYHIAIPILQRHMQLLSRLNADYLEHDVDSLQGSGVLSADATRTAMLSVMEKGAGHISQVSNCGRSKLLCSMFGRAMSCGTFIGSGSPSS